MLFLICDNRITANYFIFSLFFGRYEVRRVFIISHWWYISSEIPTSSSWNNYAQWEDCFLMFLCPSNQYRRGRNRITSYIALQFNICIHKVEYVIFNSSFIVLLCYVDISRNSCEVLTLKMRSLLFGFKISSNMVTYMDSIGPVVNNFLVTEWNSSVA